MQKIKERLVKLDEALLIAIEIITAFLTAIILVYTVWACELCW